VNLRYDDGFVPSWREAGAIRTGQAFAGPYAPRRADRCSG